MSLSINMEMPENNPFTYATRAQSSKMSAGIEEIVHQPQQFPRSDMSQMRSKTKQKIMDFLIQNARTIPSSSRETSISSEVQEKGRETQIEMKATVERIEVKCERTLEDNTELGASKMKIEELDSKGDRSEERLLLKMTRVHELEEELRSAKDMISILRAEVKSKLLLEERISTMQRRLDNDAGDELYSGDHKFWSEESGALPSALANQAAVDKQSIKGLESSLEKAEDTICKLHEGNAEMPEVKIKLNSRLIEWTTHQAAKDESKLNAVEGKIVELQDNLTTISTLKKDMELQTIELIEANVRIEELTLERTSLLEENQKLFSKAEHLDELEEDLRFIEGDAPRWDRVEIQEKLGDYLEKLKQRIMFLEDKCAQLILKVDTYESIQRGATPAELSICYHQLIQENKDLKGQLEGLRREGDEFQAEGEQTAGDVEGSVGKSSISQLQIQQEHQDLQIEREKYFIRVSDQNYLKLCWKKL